MQILNGYTLDEKQWKAKGGGGQYNIATKDGKVYFIKRLAFPRYPDSDIFKGEFKQKKIDICNEWFRHRQEIIRAISGSGTGTTVKPIEYFREGPCYYEVANMIEVTSSIPYEEVYKESKEDRARIMLTVSMSLSDLHKKGIVHGNLNPDNILIYRLPGNMNPVVRLIGFTNAFFENEPPEVITSEVAWQSPEVIHYNQADAVEIAPNPYQKDISCKLDVFSLGIVFLQYCTKGGKPPICTKNQPWQEFNAGKTPQIDSAIEPEFRALIADMLECEPSKRPAMADVHKRLVDILKGRKDPEEEQKKREEEVRKENNKEEKSSSGLQVGNGIKSARLHEKNPRKVVVVYDNGKEQILDLSFAIRQGYVKN